MKINPTKTIAAIALIVTLTAESSFAAIVSAPACTVSIGAGTNISTSTLAISNAGNQVWIIQTSSDLIHWTEGESWKVHNGSFHRTFIRDDSVSNLFFRAFYDPSRQDIFSATSNALLLPASSFNYAAPLLPLSFTVNPILAQDNTPLTNITTDAGATLGRVLFYDKRLSTNQTVACASCHRQKSGFSDPQRFSVGFDGSVGTRNAMGLSNARWYQRRHFF